MRIVKKNSVKKKRSLQCKSASVFVRFRDFCDFPVNREQCFFSESLCWKWFLFVSPFFKRLFNWTINIAYNSNFIEGRSYSQSPTAMRFRWHCFTTYIPWFSDCKHTSLTWDNVERNRRHLVRTDLPPDPQRNRCRLLPTLSCCLLFLPCNVVLGQSTGKWRCSCQCSGNTCWVQTV